MTSQDVNTLRSRNPHSPFTEVWHNSQPLVVSMISSIPKGTFCYQCGVKFPRGSLLVQPCDLLCISTKMTTKYYCVNNNCVIARFPYFCREFLDVTKVQLQSDHKEYIKAELGINLQE